MSRAGEVASARPNRGRSAEARQNLAQPSGATRGDHALASDRQPVQAPDFDRLIHERMRLGIVSALAVNASLTFNELKALLGTTDGNLSVHARKLEEAAYITCNRSSHGRPIVPAPGRPPFGRLSKMARNTSYRLTAAGRRALERYLDHMEALIRATRER